MRFIPLSHESHLPQTLIFKLHSRIFVNAGGTAVEQSGHECEPNIKWNDVLRFYEVCFCIVKQIEIMLHIIQFPPITNINRIVVKIIDLSIFH